VPRTCLTARDAFAEHFDVTALRWRSDHVTRLLRLTGERPQRVADARAILGDLGMGHGRSAEIGGVFDHGVLWGRSRTPLMIVGHPYGIDADERSWLAELGRCFPGLTVAVDDRPSYYGSGTNHVRIALAEVRRPFTAPPSTPKTREAARTARNAFADVFA
jgi:hypothetical protein